MSRNAATADIPVDAPDAASDAPAGRLGPVVARDGHFFTGEKRIRFWGVNLCFSACFPTHEQADKLASAARNAEDASRLARVRFDAGVVDFLIVLDAERQSLVARDALVQAQVGQATSLVSIYRALGGGWSDAPAPALAAR